MSTTGSSAARPERASQPPAKELAYDYIRREILWKPGVEAEFLAEEAVGKALGLSRTPVREAFLRLEAEGFIQLVPRKGALIRAITEREIRDVMEVRLVAETWAARKVLSDPGAQAELLGRLEDLHASLIGLRDADDAVAFIDCDREFHRAIIAASDNQVLLDFYERLRDLQLRMGLRVLGESAARIAAVNAEHQEILDALRGGDGDEVHAAISRHLEATGRVLLRS
jgi:DNA-binding GntR family transcriptional regulator